jgi:hypothetical protein
MTTPTSYFELIESLWTGERDFIVLEEDVLPADAVIDSMARCSDLWCSGAFAMDGGLGSTALGFSRFSARLQREIPDAMEQVAIIYPQRYWVCLDAALIERVLEKRFRPHVHLPAAEHLHGDGPVYEAPVFEGRLEQARRRTLESTLWLLSSGIPAGNPAAFGGAQRAVMYTDDRSGRRP